MPTLLPVQILTAIAPETDCVPEERRNVILALAEDQTGQAFGSARNHAVALLAAHMLTIGNRAGNAGAVSQAKEGDLSLSYAVNQYTDDALDGTSYGQELKRLRKTYIFGPRMSGFVSDCL